MRKQKMDDNETTKRRYRKVAEDWGLKELETGKRFVYRTVVKARNVSGSVVISVPMPFLRAMGASEGDFIELAYTEGEEKLEVRLYSKELEMKG